MNKGEMEIIKRALYEIELCEVNAFDSLAIVDIPRSSEYIDKMNALINKKTVVSSSVFGKGGSVKKKIIAALIAAAILLFATACAFREPIMEFLIETFEEFTNFSFDGEQKKLLEEHYLPTYIPEGYVETSVTKNKTSANAYWSNGEREIFLLQWTLANQSASLDTEDGGYTVDYIGEQAVYYICKNNTYVFLWENDEYSFILNCPEDLGLDGVKRFIGSLEPNN